MDVFIRRLYNLHVKFSVALYGKLAVLQIRSESNEVAASASEVRYRLGDIEINCNTGIIIE